MRHIRTIDCDYLYPKFAASYLVSEGGRAYFVETNTSHALPRMLRALSEEGLTPNQVEYVIITHAHLDHSAGAHALMEACPEARLLCHPRAQKHIIDPVRLETSARQVYGNETFDRLYGKLKAISSQRVYSPADGERIRFGSSELEFLHTRGHANHHFCIKDAALNAVFTGDAFGLAYPALQHSARHIFPSTSPTEFDAQEAKKSVLKIIETGVNSAYLTHFGLVDWLDEARRSLLEQLDFAEELSTKARDSSLGGSELISFCERELRNFIEQNWKNANLNAEQWAIVKLDIELNAADIAYSAERGRAKPVV